jgi:hypothetical protein
VVQEVHHQSTAWSTCHLWDSCTNPRSSSGAIAHSINNSASRSNSNNSSTLMLPLHRSKQYSLGHCNSLHQSDTRASTAVKLVTLPRNRRLLSWHPQENWSPRVVAPIVNQQRGPAPWTGHIHYTIMEEIPTREEVLMGTSSFMIVLSSYYLIPKHYMTL